MKQEKALRICKKCGKQEDIYQYGKFPSGTKRFRDGAEKLWIGKLCSQCHRDRMREYMRKKRDSRSIKIES